MRDGIIYDCPNANCRTPIDTGKCSKACIEKYNKEMGIKPKNNADRMIEMLKTNDAASLLDWWEEIFEDGVPSADYFEWWLKQPAE